MMKLHNVLLAGALGAGTLLGAAAPASAARVVVTTRPAARRVFPGHPYYGTRYSVYRYRSGYAYPYAYGYGYPYGVGFGVSTGYGVGGGSYGYVGAGYVYRPYGRPYRRAYRVRRVIR